MYRYLVQTFEPAPELEGDRWVAILCPPDSDPQMVEPGAYRFLIGSSVVTVRALGDRYRDWTGPAFEVAAGDDLPGAAASGLMAGVWDRFSRAVTQRIVLPGGRGMTTTAAHLLTLEVPPEVYPLGSDDPARR